MTDTMTNLLDIENLRVRFPTRQGHFDAVRGISFSLRRERLGIVGESGSGKSMTGRAILKLIRKPGQITADRMQMGGTNLLTASERQMRQIRGRHASMIMQDPKFSLNPVMSVGQQITEALLAHEKISRRDAKTRAIEMLDAVAIRGPDRVMDLYPHEVSGGMGQRIMIAMMLIPDPEILIADEPTSALDVSVQLQVLEILDKLVTDRGMGLIFISHDLNLVSNFCDRILIMYAGRVVEVCQAGRLHEAQHPYTRGLLNSVPDLEHPRPRLDVLKRDPAWAEAPSVSALT
ncbi:peptide ABC transporter ATP-binding protein [Salipiger aestuarii]|uniref:Peptide/nickel transport system ATP-binding protein n=2 Tax=Salipiger aestuarii TaxID=568098 RepID=A0A327YSX8_9RHOB|nr:peptide ABC transporter ATP-binding protein [Salipiger aestuarii]KAB2543598.1 peptide ABC transporter ATP-binding protein [Salipiger aestuarii]RAK22825.1 peptide/nickel transport system ATP-binding protein [Salipiger aestuarii]